MLRLSLEIKDYNQIYLFWKLEISVQQITSMFFFQSSHSAIKTLYILGAKVPLEIASVNK